jgi:hypothetical protein
VGSPIRKIRRIAGGLAPPGTRRRQGLNHLVDPQTASQEAAYAAWVRTAEDTRSPAALPAGGPTISLVVPVFNPPEPSLTALIVSVLEQSYRRWELCLADASTDGRCAETVRRLAAGDERVRLLALGENRGIAGNTNTAIEAATGEYLAFLDHDDTLAPFALAAVAAAVTDDPSVDLVFTDEDKLSGDGRRRSSPFFKPGWSSDLFTCANYLSHLVTVRSGLAGALGGLREGFDGAQDYDFLLRLLERDPVIHHIPRVAYHWRMVTGSTARDPSAKRAAQSAGARALGEHLARRGVPARVVPMSGDATSYRVSYDLVGTPTIHVLTAAGSPAGTVPIAAAEGLAVQALSDLAAVADLPPTDLVLLRELPGTPRDEGWLQDLAAVAQQPGTGLVAPALTDAGGGVAALGYVAAGDRLWPAFAGDVLDRWTLAGWSGWPRNAVALGGWAVATAATVRQALGASGGDRTIARLSLAAHRAGLRNVTWPFARVVTPEAVAPVALPEPVDDPYLNPNLAPGSPLSQGMPAGRKALSGSRHR